MSCHDIGHALNSVVEEIIDLNFEGEIDNESTKRLIHTAKEAVNYCDGNEYEAIECLEDYKICSACLEQYDCLYDLSNEIDYDSEIYEEIEKNTYYISTIMCEECIEKLLLEKLQEKEAKEILEKLKDSQVL